MNQMKLINKMCWTLCFSIVVISLYGCSSTTNQYSPDQVIQNALDEETPSYYGEIETITNVEGEKIKEIMREWRSTDGKTRIEIQGQDGSNETITVNDGTRLTLYEIAQNKAYIIDDVDVLSFNLSPREQVNMLLEMIRDTHELSNKEGEKVGGRDTYQIIGEVKKESSLFGDVELWIDKETWLILKMTLHAGDSVTTTAYKKIDYNPKMSSELFVIDLPENVEVESMTNMLDTLDIPLEDIPTKIGGSVYYFPETEGLEISSIEVYELQGELNRNEVNLDYTKDGLPLLTLSIFETEHKGSSMEDEIVNIRGYKGNYTTFGDVRTLLWEEDGLTYSVLLIDPNFSLEELVHLTERMDMIQ